MDAFGKKRYFLPLGRTPKTGVGFIAKKITVLYTKFTHIHIITTLKLILT